MTIEIQKNADELVLEVTGRLDTITAPALDKIIIENLEEIKSLVLDFSNLEYISSAGLRVLLGAQKKMQDMVVINVCESVMDVFEITGFADILTIR